MERTIKVRFSQGVIKPLEKVEFSEGEEFTVTIHEIHEKPKKKFFREALKATDYLIDTDWIIDHFRGVELITKKLENIAPQGVAISVISLAEIYEGIFTSKDTAKS